MQFARTLPAHIPVPLRLTDPVSAPPGVEPPSTLRGTTTGRPSALGNSLLSDLHRFADGLAKTDLLPVLAASTRHVKPLTVHLRHEDRVIALSAFPREQLFHCSLDLCALSPEALARLHLVNVGPVVGEPPPLRPVVPGTPHIGALAPLLWQLALHGSRDDLLPEIAGRVRYRCAAGASLKGLPVDPACAALLAALRGGPVTLAELGAQTTLTRPRVQRFLNAVYLQAWLMVTRS